MNRKLPPYRTFLASDSSIRDLLRDHRVLAFCGLSATGDPDALDVARRLKQRGYRVVPVTPDGGEVLGVEAARDVDAIRERIGIVVLWRGAADAL
ncbi:MAG: CoA-binding protein [Planctomycetota bacterium JB042]